MEIAECLLNIFPGIGIVGSLGQSLRRWGIGPDWRI
jgi:hypothetical protein